MQCPDCGYMLYPFDKDCPRCASLKARPIQMPVASASVAPSPSKKVIFCVIAGLALVGSVLGVMVFTQSSHSTANPTHPIRSPRPASPRPAMMTPPAISVPIRAPTDSLPTPPPLQSAPQTNEAESTSSTEASESTNEGERFDVENYLAFVRQIEARKMEMIRQQTAEMAQLSQRIQSHLSRKTSSEQSDRDMQDMNAAEATAKANWIALQIDFSHLSGPAVCYPLKEAYSRSLGLIVQNITSVNSAMALANTHPNIALNQLNNMQGNASARIADEIQKANRALQELCQKYNLPKDFDIRGE